MLDPIIEETPSSDLGGEARVRCRTRLGLLCRAHSIPRSHPMRTSACFASFLLLLAVPVAAEVQKTSGMHNGKPYVEATDHREITATVLSADRTTRVLTMRTEAGDTLATVVEPEVRDFGQIQVGDMVKASITEQIRIAVASGTDTKTGYEVSGTSGKPGEKPHGTITETARATATVAAIDKTTGAVKLKSQAGDVYTVTARDKANLDKVKVGNTIVFTVTRSVAASVVKAK
jgi:hypothetical protein